MIRTGFAIASLTAGLLMAASAFPQGEKEGQGQAVVTVMPKHEGGVVQPVAPQELKLKIDGKDTKIVNFVPLKGGIELVLLIDSSARSSLGTQLSEIGRFVQSLPPNVRVAIAYMENGRAAMAGPLSADHAAVLKGLHMPAGSAGSSASPYFCLSDLAKNWPSQDRSPDSSVRREVIMITDGVDNYNLQYDPDDPYVQAAINDAVRAELVVYSIYWRSQGRLDSSLYENNAGQSLLLTVAQATGGKSFWEGTGNPVSFQPYFEELTRRFQNQYELSFLSPLKGKPAIENLKLKLSAPGVDANGTHANGTHVNGTHVNGTELNAPGEVLVGPAALRGGMAEN